MMCSWRLGREGKYSWFNLEMFFTAVVTSPPFFQENVIFTGIDFQHLRCSIAK